MFGFLIKKNFFEGWDNIFNLVIANVVFLLCSMLIAGFAALFYHYPLLFIPFFLLFCALAGTFSFAYGQVSADIANFKGVHIGDFFGAIPASLKDGSLFGMLCGLIALVSILGMKFYITQISSILGFLLAAFLFWVDIVLILSFQWFVAIRSLMKNDFKKCLRKCFLIFFDNTGFSIAMGFYTLILLVFSVFCLGFIPSFAGINLARVNALRLLLYKYDYLDEHPELESPRQRKNIPWEELIYEDRETLGPNRLKQMIFPWKN